ncbi:MAG: hypothetical protein IKZ87_06510 [Actinomycetaceae bacterium]|nr:hypothetical protein [Actinomycetaceae bacterium]
MTSENVVLELTRLSFPVPLHTFNYWLQGYFLPRSETAFQIVSMLENIFGLIDNRLSDALLEDLSSGASFVPGENIQKELAPFPEEYKRFSRNADDEADWQANVVQKVVRDDVVLSADRKYVKHKVTILARVPPAPNPTFFFQISHKNDMKIARGDIFYDLSGISLKKCDVFEENGFTIYAAQFALPDDVVPGDLHSFSYACDEKTTEPITEICDRFLPWTLDFYSGKVTFEGGVPEGVRYVTLKQEGGREVEVPNDLTVTHYGESVSVSTKNFGNIIGYFEVPSSADSENLR